MRAFRPSRYSPVEVEGYIDRDAQSVRDNNLLLYSKRAQDNLPLFGEPKSAEKSDQSSRRLAISKYA